MSMAELVAAGAPELPEGYFYRVRDTSIQSLKVEIRRQRLVGSAYVAGWYVFPEGYATAKAAVVRACREAHREWELAAGSHAKYVLARAIYAGDHDPRGGR